MMGNCWGIKITEYWKQTPQKNVENKTFTTDQNLEDNDGYYPSDAIPMRAMVFVTPKYVRRFPKFTMPPFFRVSNSTSTENFNQTSSNSNGISSNQNQVTADSSSSTQHSTESEHQQSVSSEHTLTTAQDSSKTQQRLLEHDSVQTSALQSSSETESLQHLLELELHQSSSAPSLSETESGQHLSDSRKIIKLQTLTKNIEIANLDGVHEIRDGAVVFVPPKYVKDYLESTRPSSFGAQSTNSNSTNNFNQTSTNSLGISSNHNHSEVSSSVAQYSTEHEHQQSVSSENSLTTAKDSSDAEQCLIEPDPSQSTSSETDIGQHTVEPEPQ